jgi:hypothetical protein
MRRADLRPRRPLPSRRQASGAGRQPVSAHRCRTCRHATAAVANPAPASTTIAIASTPGQRPPRTTASLTAALPHSRSSWRRKARQPLRRGVTASPRMQSPGPAGPTSPTATRDSLAHRAAGERSRLKTIIASTSADMAPLPPHSNECSTLREAGSSPRPDGLPGRRLRPLARRGRASMVASGRVLPVGRRPIQDRLPPGSGRFAVQGRSHEQQETSWGTANPGSGTRARQRAEPRRGRVFPSAAWRACQRSISGRSQRLGRPRPRSRTGRGMS